MQRRNLLPLGLLPVVAACAPRIAPIHRGSGYFTGTASLTRRSDEIKRAAARRGWIMTEQAPGWLRGTLNLRTHQAVVDVRFDTERFTITYVSSQDLNYEQGYIHPNYNQWIRYLEQDIALEAQRTSGLD
ncbi:hypothetical protein VQH23_02770 [Pararoseomonas sp. SCSIO 73927]|uniref:hypothetical protein n=1 Tax=Pararoseomonas sp. SCSIO 73927 TaxID=3114537 RepID=UPI0030CF3339